MLKQCTVFKIFAKRSARDEQSDFLCTLVLISCFPPPTLHGALTLSKRRQTFFQLNSQNSISTQPTANLPSYLNSALVLRIIKALSMFHLQVLIYLLPQARRGLSIQTTNCWFVFFFFTFKELSETRNEIASCCLPTFRLNKTWVIEMNTFLANSD